jgi:hypothetical protein
MHSVGYFYYVQIVLQFICSLFISPPPVVLKLYFGHGVLKQFRFYAVGLSDLHSTSSNPGRLMDCFLIWLLTANLPVMGGPTSNYHHSLVDH